MVSLKPLALALSFLHIEKKKLKNRGQRLMHFEKVLDENTGKTKTVN